MQKTTTYITFAGKHAGRAEEAIKFYVSLFKNSKVDHVLHYKADEYGGDEGMVKLATFTLDGQQYMAAENNETHEWGASPAVSIYVQCDDEDEIDTLYKKLSEDGEARIPLDDYGFSKKFGWTDDKYGVSWQLNLGKLNLESEKSEL
jgi:predicted 3-demethylubiquinone-9 3-methyltransferase (glyoxalase superfamily)